MSSKQIIKDLKNVRFGLGLMSFTMKPKPYSQKSFNDTILATIKKNLPNKTFINGGEFYGLNDLNLKYIKTFLDHYPDEREKLIISIKGAMNPATFSPNGDRKSVQKSIDNVRRYVPDLDMFECARVDPKVQIEETIKTLDENVENGNIKSFGLSEVGINTLTKISQISKNKIAALEVEFSIFSRELLDTGLAAKAGELGIPVIAYSPLSKGILTGEIKTASDLPKGDIRSRFHERFNDENLKKNAEIVEYIEKFASKKNITPAQFSLAWVRYWSEKEIDGVKFPKIIDIPSTSTVERVEENFSDVELTKDEFDETNKFIKGVIVHGRRYNPQGDRFLLL